MKQREIRKIVASRPTSDGDGVKISRLTGFKGELSMDPFMMLDEIRSDDKDDFVGGFPPHPHRGFETVTYMKAGGFSHEDSMGNKGSITSGGAQWMSAASGVIHSEMPVMESDRIHGFQFWLNLPAAEKMDAPRYRDIRVDEIAEISDKGSTLRLIAGELEFAGKPTQGVVVGKSTQALVADVQIEDDVIQVKMKPDLQLQFYVYQGSVQVQNEIVKQGQLAYLTDGDDLSIESREASGLLLFGGAPIKENVAHYGPFVMNTEAEIQQAIQDYQNGVLVQ